MPRSPAPATPTIDASSVAARLRLPVTRLARQLRQQDISGLTPSLTAALATIAREGPLTLGELAAKEAVTPPTITRFVAALEARGFVARQNDAGDRRVCRVAVTSAGKRELDTNRLRRTAWLTGRLSELSSSDLRRLDDAADVLERLVLGREGEVSP